MRKTVILFLISFFVISCSSEKNFSDMKNATIINGKSDTVIVEKNEYLKYSFEALPSADLRVSYSISDENIISFYKTESQQNNSDPDDDGGDRIIGFYVFKANKKGICTLTFTETLHGDVQYSDQINIRVE